MGHPVAGFYRVNIRIIFDRTEPIGTKFFGKWQRPLPHEVCDALQPDFRPPQPVNFLCSVEGGGCKTGHHGAAGEGRSIFR